MKKLLIAWAVILFWVSCAPRVSTDDAGLDEVYMLTHSSPDSARAVLNRIDKRNLNEAQTMYYELLKIRINDLQNMDITEDEEMLSVVKNYFEKQEQNEKLAWAYFYEGRINLKNENLEAATWNFNKANEYSGSDLALKSKSQSGLGYIYFTNQAFKDALHWYKEAYETSLQTDFQSSIHSAFAMGNIYLHLQKSDSALYYYNRAIDLSETFENDSLRFDILQNTIVALYTAEKYSQAMDLCRQCYREFDIKADKEKEYYMAADLSIIYYHTGNLDSLLHYAKITEQYAVEKQDLPKLVNAYQLLSVGEEKKGNYKKALKYNRRYAKYNDELAQKTELHKIEEVQEKYDTEVLENERNRLVIEKQHRTIILIVVIILSIGAIAIFISILLKHKGYIFRLEEVAANSRKMARRVILGKMDIVKPIMALIESIEKSKKDENVSQSPKARTAISEIITLVTPQLIISSIDEIDPDYVKAFRAKFPELNETESVICFMLLLEFKSAEIADFLKVESNTIQRRESKIRKKLGIQKGGNIQKHLEISFKPIA